jgi:hypothetical protein
MVQCMFWSTDGRCNEITRYFVSCTARRYDGGCTKDLPYTEEDECGD